MSERGPSSWPVTGVTTCQGPGSLTLTCSACKFEKRWTSVLPPSKTRDRATKAGWAINKRWTKATCPQCTNCEAKEREIEAMSTNSKKLFKPVFLLLSDHYDEGLSTYEPGWDDERIAKDVGCSPKFVSDIREEHYGPAEDPRIGNLREQLATVRTEASDEAQAIKNMVDEMLAKVTTKLDSMGTTLAKVTRGHV